MKNRQIEERFSPARQLPLNHIGVVYCTSNLTAKDRELEKLADCEVIDVAHAVQAALQEKGYSVEEVVLDPLRINALEEFDWVINLTETIYGFPFTDFEIAEQMERLNINFTGSGSHALKSCLDKAETKAELLKHGILTPAYDVFCPGDVIWTKCSYPVIVKPVHEDGSIGISNESIAWNMTELIRCIEKIHCLYHQAALVEEFIEGRDITASILGNGKESVALPLSEILYSDSCGSKFLTFDTKWVAESADYQTCEAKCPCSLDPQVEALIKQTALMACQIMGCRDYARVDFRLKGDIPYVIEVNPNPCINPDDSGFVRCAMAAGYSYTELIEAILMNSVKNYGRIRELVSYHFLQNRMRGRR